MERPPKKTLAYIKIFEKKSKEKRMPIAIDFKKKYERRIPRKTDNIKPGLNKCYFPWDYITIDNYGNVSGCCENNLILDKITTYEEGLFDIWNNKNFIELRKTLNTPNQPKICSTCHFKTRG